MITRVSHPSLYNVFISNTLLGETYLILNHSPTSTGFASCSLFFSWLSYFFPFLRGLFSSLTMQTYFYCMLCRRLASEGVSINLSRNIMDYDSVLRLMCCLTLGNSLNSASLKVKRCVS